MNKIKKSKSYNFLAVIVCIGIYFAVYIYWSVYCVSGQCTYDLRNNFLRPVSIGSVFLSVFFSILLLLPSHFFKAWFKYIFSWGFPLAVYMTYITTGSNSIPAYGKAEVVKFWGMFFAVVSMIFIVVIYWREKRNK